jgi:hypothetical protein
MKSFTFYSIFLTHVFALKRLSLMLSAFSPKKGQRCGCFVHFIVRCDFIKNYRQHDRVICIITFMQVVFDNFPYILYAKIEYVGADGTATLLNAIIKLTSVKELN